MTALTLLRRCAARRRAFALGAACLFALVGCRTDKELKGSVTGGKTRPDPLVHGPSRIPKQDLPVPERGIGGKGKSDPLTTPAGGRGDKVGYTDDPERFKGTVLPGKPSTPAALAGRVKDGDELKIEDTGVPLSPAGGAVPADPGEGVSELFGRLERLGVKRADRSLAFEGGKWVCRASVAISSEGARRQYTGAADIAADAVRQVVEQIAADRK